MHEDLNQFRTKLTRDLETSEKKKQRRIVTSEKNKILYYAFLKKTLKTRKIIYAEIMTRHNFFMRIL
jgi:hypothetical protein